MTEFKLNGYYLNTNLNKQKYFVVCNLKKQTHMIFNLQGHKLSKSINLTILLIFCIVGQHLIRILNIQILGITLLIEIITMYYTILFLISLKKNLIDFFDFQKIIKVVNNLVIAYCVLTVLIILDEYFKFNYTNVDSFAIMIFSLTFILGLIYLLISYLILGLNLIKNYNKNILKDLLYLGYSYAILTPIGMIISMIILSMGLKNISHLAIIFELIPLLLVIRIYKTSIKNDEKMVTHKKLE